MIIACARRGTPRGHLYLRTFLTFVSPRKVKGGRVAALCADKPMPELCLSYAPRCRCPRSPLAASGQRSAHPLPSRPRLRPSFSSSYSPDSTDLLSRVVSPSTILVRRGRTDIAASSSCGVGGMQVYVYVGRTYETAGQQDLTTRATVFLLGRSHLETYAHP